AGLEGMTRNSDQKWRRRHRSVGPARSRGPQLTSAPSVTKSPISGSLLSRLRAPNAAEEHKRPAAEQQAERARLRNRFHKTIRRLHRVGARQRCEGICETRHGSSVANERRSTAVRRERDGACVGGREAAVEPPEIRAPADHIAPRNQTKRV